MRVRRNNVIKSIEKWYYKNISVSEYKNWSKLLFSMKLTLNTAWVTASEPLNKSYNKASEALKTLSA